MKPIPVEGDEARSSEGFSTYFMAPLSFAYREIIKRLEYNDQLSWFEKEAIRAKFIEATLSEAKHIVAHCPGYRRALLPSSITIGMEHEDLMGFTAPDTRRLAIFEEDTERNALFVPRTPEQFEYEAFREWSLFLYAAHYMAILEHLKVRRHTGDDPETNDEYFLYSAHSAVFERPGSIKLPDGDRDALRAHIEEKHTEWLKLPQHMQPTQENRFSYFKGVVEGIPIKEIEAMEREISANRFRGRGRPPKPPAE